MLFNLLKRIFGSNNDVHIYLHIDGSININNQTNNNKLQSREFPIMAEPSVKEAFPIMWKLQSENEPIINMDFSKTDTPEVDFGNDSK